AGGQPRGPAARPACLVVAPAGGDLRAEAALVGAALDDGSDVGRRAGPSGAGNATPVACAGHGPPPPARLRLYALSTLPPQRWSAQGAPGVRSPAGSHTPPPTVSAAIAGGRRQWWEPLPCSMSPQETERIKMPRAWFDRFSRPAAQRL